MSFAPKVILYQISRGPRAPSLSPFALKLETFLRMAKIEYQNDFSVKRSSKGKIPWMKYEGEAVADSQFCVEYLNRKLNIDLNSHLTEEQRAVAHAFRKMAEENLFWCMGLSRAENLDYVKKHIKLNKLVIWIGTRIYLSNTKAHGIGRHTHEEVLHIMEEDLRSLVVYLGRTKFFFRDQPVRQMLLCLDCCASFAGSVHEAKGNNS